MSSFHQLTLITFEILNFSEGLFKRLTPSSGPYQNSANSLVSRR